MKITNKIITNIKVTTKEEAIKTLLDNLNEENQIKEKIFQEIIERENIENTVLGFGFCVPHTKTNAIKYPYIIYGQLTNEIKWSNDEEYIKHIFLIIIPLNSVNLHIDILKNISKKIINNDFRNLLNNTANINDLDKIINE